MNIIANTNSVSNPKKFQNSFVFVTIKIIHLIIFVRQSNKHSSIFLIYVTYKHPKVSCYYNLFLG